MGMPWMDKVMGRWRGQRWTERSWMEASWMDEVMDRWRGHGWMEISWMDGEVTDGRRGNG